MRISTWLRLLALCLIAGALPASPLAARPPVAQPKKPLVSEEFTGRGVTEHTAQEEALEQACAWLKQNTGLDWTPDSTYLREHKMVQFGAAEEKTFEVAKDITKDGKMNEVKMRLEITDSQVRDMQKQAQNHRMKDRQKTSLLVLIGVMGLIGVVGGYLRLEEATKGYYTRLLRIAAICVLVVIVASLFVA